MACFIENETKLWDAITSAKLSWLDRIKILILKRRSKLPEPVWLPSCIDMVLPRGQGREGSQKERKFRLKNGIFRALKSLNLGQTIDADE